MDYSAMVFTVFVILIIITTGYFLRTILGFLKLKSNFKFKITCPKSFFYFYLGLVLILIVVGVIRLNTELNFYLIIALFLASRFVEVYLVAYSKDELYYKHKYIRNIDFYKAIQRRNRMYIKEVNVSINLLDYNRIEYIIGEK